MMSAFAAVLLWSGVAFATPADNALRAPPEGFVDLATAVHGIQLAPRYHTPDNFTGAPLQGYGAAGAWQRTSGAQGGGDEYTASWLSERLETSLAEKVRAVSLSAAEFQVKNDLHVVTSTRI